MHKTPSVFLRNPENMNEMTREVNPLCQWVLDGEGVATRKYDGNCVMLDEDGHKRDIVMLVEKEGEGG